MAPAREICRTLVRRASQRTPVAAWGEGVTTSAHLDSADAGTGVLTDLAIGLPPARPPDTVAAGDSPVAPGSPTMDLGDLRIAAGVQRPAAGEDTPALALAPCRRSSLRARRAVALVLVGAATAICLSLPHAGGRPTAAKPPAVRDGPTVALSVFPAAAGLTCQLPVSALSNDHTTGFIYFGAGRSTFTPVHTQGTTYVPALHRWVDVLPQFVAPDGSSYVTQNTEGATSTITLVDAHGERRLLRTTNREGAFAFTSMGILLITPSGPDATTVDLRLLDPRTGRVRPDGSARWLSSRMITGAGSSAGYLRAGEALWITDYDPTQNSTDVWRYDLASGSTTQWFDGSVNGHGHVEVVAADAEGHPILQLSSPDLFHTDPVHRDGVAVQTLLLSSPHHAAMLNGGRVGTPGVAGSLSPLSVTQGGEVWLASDDGAIWLYRPASGLQEVAKITTSTRGAPGVAISGPCA